MKNLLFILFLLFSNLSTAQVVTLMYVEVSNENQQRFERLEKDYWSQIAKKAIDDGKMMSWIMLKEISIPGTHKYLFVNYFENLEQLNQSSSIWNPEKIGMNFEDIDTFGIKRIVNVEYWKAEGLVGESAKYVIMNYFSPANLEGFVTENLELWKPWFEKSIKNNLLKQTNWAIGTKIYPSGNQTGSFAITRDGFDSLSDAMEALSYQPLSNSVYASIVEKSKMNVYVPNGVDKRVLYEVIKIVD
jgi:hypothetical protein|uniref:hypothetical protein n=1 Tax=Algoriphagus sp. TaxID=1872435 RepID=UPI004048E17A